LIASQNFDVVELVIVCVEFGRKGGAFVACLLTALNKLPLCDVFVDGCLVEGEGLATGGLGAVFVEEFLRRLLLHFLD
jgi:hypothetical protein